MLNPVQVSSRLCTFIIAQLCSTEESPSWMVLNVSSPTTVTNAPVSISIATGFPLTLIEALERFVLSCSDLELCVLLPTIFPWFLVLDWLFCHYVSPLDSTVLELLAAHLSYLLAEVTGEETGGCLVGGPSLCTAVAGGPSTSVVARSPLDEPLVRWRESLSAASAARAISNALSKVSTASTSSRRWIPL